MLRDIPTTLALDPTSAGFAFAVLQGSETLLEWACSEVSTKEPAEWRRRVEKLVARYQPSLLVLAALEDVRAGTWAERFNRDMASFAHDHGIPLRRVSQQEVREEFAGSGKKKHEIAVAVARFFPELEPRLPPPRKTWMGQDKRMGIFDAVSFALTALRHVPPRDL